ncbi:hypothetical protein Pmani_008211 [Petrolisthes manimaculis]|uniref:Uncharacterized protein n=1 Tax=Petrolisthes manimaculis TaxID=1843537 RepID=A0AAE1UEU8_9EUCA|nr:hypothetical protein Pmani_008211 [Petrolisthes manimaculis]
MADEADTGTESSPTSWTHGGGGCVSDAGCPGFAKAALLFCQDSSVDGPSFTAVEEGSEHNCRDCLPETAKSTAWLALEIRLLTSASKLAELERVLPR